LVLELPGDSRRAGRAGLTLAPRISCTIGEKMRQERWGGPFFSSALTAEFRDDLHVVGIAELIDGRNGSEFVTAADQDLRIVDERCRIKLPRRNRNRAFGKFARLRFASGAADRTRWRRRP
jgi:hypothetical protein